MTKLYPKKITTYVTTEQYAWTRALPKSYNLNAKIREILDMLIKTEAKQ